MVNPPPTDGGVQCGICSIGIIGGGCLQMTKEEDEEEKIDLQQPAPEPVPEIIEPVQKEPPVVEPPVVEPPVVEPPVVEPPVVEPPVVGTTCS